MAGLVASVPALDDSQKDIGLAWFVRYNSKGFLSVLKDKLTSYELAYL